MKFVIGQGDSEVLKALRQMLENADQISLAVSYMQLSGWKLLNSLVPEPAAKSLRIVCTDQMGITDPAAVREAQQSGTLIRNFRSHGRIYHPKLYLAQRRGKNASYMCGSSNLSSSALCTSVELNLISEDDGTLEAWFENCFDEATDFTESVLERMEAAHFSRISGQLFTAKAAKERGYLSSAVVDANELVDSVLGGIGNEIGLLNFDHTGNTVRNMKRAQELLKEHSSWEGKNASELNHLGLATQGKINHLGQRFRDAPNLEAAADIWVKWLFESPDLELNKINPIGRLVWCRRALKRFWKLDKTLINFFLDNAHNPSLDIKRFVQIIELISNSRSASSGIDLEDLKTLSQLISENPELSGSYLNNKGARGWGSKDRLHIVKSARKYV